MKYLVNFVALILLATLLPSCSTAFLTSSWTNETYTPQPYEKVLVFAIASQTSSRAAVEGAVTDELRKLGINAVSALSVFPGSQKAITDQQTMVSQEELTQKLIDNHIDGLLLLSLLDRKVEEVYVEGQTHTQTQTLNQGVYSEPIYNTPQYDYYNYHPNGYHDRYDQYYNNYYSYYQTVQTTVTEPGYYENQTTLYLESNFYKVNDASLVWSGQSEVVDAADVRSGAVDWAVVLGKALTKYNIIIPSNP